MKRLWSTEEKEDLLQETIGLIGQKRITSQQLQDICTRLNDKYWEGVHIRKENTVGPMVYVMRKQMAAGEEPTGKTPRKAAEKSAMPLLPGERTISQPKSYSSESLNKLVRCAKDIKRQSCLFCDMVALFADEFERDRALMKRLKKLREAVEEFKI
jgi:hypothetical protein